MVGGELCACRRANEFVVDVAERLSRGAARVECFAGIKGGKGERRKRESDNERRNADGEKSMHTSEWCLPLSLHCNAV